MKPFALLGMFIAWPWLALVPAAVFATMFLRRRRPLLLAAVVAWGAYFPYEQAMKLRILCTGECNIRVDLLLIYPALALLSAAAVVAWLRAGWRK